MAKKLEFNLPKADDLFSTQEMRDDAKREKVIDILISELDNFPDHPFLVKMDESMQNMIDSIKAYGIQTPAIVRQKDDGRYEIVSGHRRKMASELSGLDTLPCIIREMTRDEAIIAMIDANLQREVILPSEKAKSYKMRLEAMNRQGYRTDLTSVENQQKLKGMTSRQQLSEKTGESQDKIRNYIRLTELTPQILNMVDEGKIAMRPAVEMSYLPPEQQESVLNTIDSEQSTPSHVQAMKMRKFSEEGQLNEDEILKIMSEGKANQADNFKIPREKIDKFFAPGTPADKVEETIIKALELWRKRERERNNAR